MATCGAHDVHDQGDAKRVSDVEGREGDDPNTKPNAYPDPNPNSNPNLDPNPNPNPNPNPTLDPKRNTGWRASVPPLPTPGSGKELYVDSTKGSDSAAGSVNAPLKSIGAAVAKAGAGVSN